MNPGTGAGAPPGRVVRLAILLLLLVSGAAAAQGRGGNFVISPAPGQIVFPTPGVADFDRGWIDAPALTVAVTPRNRHRSWTLSLSAGASDLGGYGKPLGTLLFRTESSGWQPVSLAGTEIGQGTGSAAVVLYFRLLLDWALDEPGTYGVDLNLLATTQP